MIIQHIMIYNTSSYSTSKTGRHQWKCTYNTTSLLHFGVMKHKFNQGVKTLFNQRPQRTATEHPSTENVLSTRGQRLVFDFGFFGFGATQDSFLFAFGWRMYWVRHRNCWKYREKNFCGKKLRNIGQFFTLFRRKKSISMQEMFF